MLLKQEDGTYSGGPLDVLCILHDDKRDTYHAAFFEECQMPGVALNVEEVTVVRLKSKMHHTTGATDLAGAQQHFDDLADKILVPDDNRERERPVPWNGTLGIVWLVSNWKQSKVPVGDVLLVNR